MAAREKAHEESIESEAETTEIRVPQAVALERMRAGAGVTRLHPSESTVVSARDPDATTFGQYELLAEIASGGMATVHLAVRRGTRGFERLVAVKRLHPHLMQNKRFCEMFVDEARIAARISHGNVCSILDFGECDDGYFITMEYLAGEPLSRVLRALKRRGGLADSPRYPLMVARIAAGFAEGLHAAHTLTGDCGQSLEVVHRDVSPQNLFVLYDGTVRVTDFGILRARERLHQTEGDMLKGKVAYMAPELIQHEPVNYRSDLWSLGVVMWEALTLRRLFSGRSEGEILMQVVSKPIPPPSHYNPNVSPAVDRIVLRALSRDQRARHGSARELARELERHLSASSDSVSAIDVSDWLQDLFPDDTRHSSARLQAALAQNVVDGRLVSPSIPAGPSDRPSDGKRATGDTAVSDSTALDEPKTLVKGRGQPAATELGAELATERRALEAPGSPPALESPDTLHCRVPAAFLMLTATAILSFAAGRFVRDGSGAGAARRVDWVGVNEMLGVARPPVTAPVPTAAEAAVRAGETPLEERASDGKLPAPALRETSARAQARPPPRPPSAKSSPPAPALQTSEVNPDIGAVLVTSRGGRADVFEHGKKLGRTPVRLRLPVGEHVLELRPTDGRASKSLSVAVRSGAVSLMTVDISAPPPPASTPSGPRGSPSSAAP